MRRFHRNTVAALAAAVLMLGAAACGGEDDPKRRREQPVTDHQHLAHGGRLAGVGRVEEQVHQAQLTSYEDAWPDGTSTSSAPRRSGRGVRPPSRGQAVQELLPLTVLAEPVPPPRLLRAG